MLGALRRWSLLLGWVAALVGTGLLNGNLKGFFRRLRPRLPEPWVTEPGWSLPSGHAMGSFVAYGFLAYLLTRITPAHFPRRKATALLAILVLLIGFSRIYLGVHSPERRYRWVRCGSRLADVLHPRDPPDPRPVASIPNRSWPETPADLPRVGWYD